MNADFAVPTAIDTILASSASRESKAKRIAEAIRLARDYRWVGIYEIDGSEIAVIGWSGPEAPSFPRFPITQGLNGAAVASRSAVAVNDVTLDPRYLTTFGSTQSEIVVPIVHPATKAVLGTIDVESVNKNAFTDADRAFLERCAGAVCPLLI